MATPLNVPKALRNIVQHVQEKPQRYHLFGVFWWAVKAMLLRDGYGPEQLYMLGPYIDANQANHLAEGLKGIGHDAVLKRALQEYGNNTFYSHTNGQVEDLDGDLVTVFDEDAAL